MILTKCRMLLLRTNDAMDQEPPPASPANFGNRYSLRTDNLLVDAHIMVEDEIAEVGIDQDGKLCVRPTNQSFPYIYRAAMEVGWDPVRGVLFGTKPREWSHLDWFRQILAAVADEYGVRLRVGAATAWSNVPELLRMQIETDQARTA
jgi:hypothetical protein